VSSSAHGCSGDLRCGPTPFASLGGRASAEARLRTQLGNVPPHLTNPHPRGDHAASLVAGPPRRHASAPSSVTCRRTSPIRILAETMPLRSWPDLRARTVTHRFSV